MTTITINGVEETPVYNFGTLRRIGEVTKKDPFSLVVDYNKPEEIYKYVQVIVHAGLLSASVKVTEAHVQEAIDKWDLKKAMQVINDFNQAFVVEAKPGEEVSAQ